MRINCKICSVEVEKKSNCMRFCKKCQPINSKRMRKEHYQKHKTREDQLNKIWRDNNQEKIKKIWKRWYQKNKIRIKKKRENEYIKEGRRKSSEKYRKKYPEKRRAHIKSLHIKIPKKQRCQNCNIRLAIEKHHNDYSKPLEVVFLCKECHTKIHGGNWFGPE